MDFRTRHDNQIFGVRATGLLVKDEKLFLVRAPEGNYYILGVLLSLAKQPKRLCNGKCKKNLELMWRLDR